MDNQKSLGRVEIRKPRDTDIPSILKVVSEGGPYLTAHSSYLYWMTIHCWADTCGVAEIDGELVGWCSILAEPGGRFFLHQHGIAAKARRMGVGEALVSYLLNKLQDQAPDFELEFTIDRTNIAAQKLYSGIANRMDMSFLKKPAVIDLLEESGGEELYVMTPRLRSIQQRDAA